MREKLKEKPIVPRGQEAGHKVEGLEISRLGPYFSDKLFFWPTRHLVISLGPGVKDHPVIPEDYVHGNNQVIQNRPVGQGHKKFLANSVDGPGSSNGGVELAFVSAYELFITPIDAQPRLHSPLARFPQYEFSTCCSYLRVVEVSHQPRP